MIKTKTITHLELRASKNGVSVYFSRRAPKGEHWDRSRIYITPSSLRRLAAVGVKLAEVTHD